jgi:hypothetical protein
MYTCKLHGEGTNHHSLGKPLGDTNDHFFGAGHGIVRSNPFVRCQTTSHKRSGTATSVTRCVAKNVPKNDPTLSPTVIFLFVKKSYFSNTCTLSFKKQGILFLKLE